MKHRWWRYLIALALFLALTGWLIYDITWHPAEQEQVPVSCNNPDASPALLIPGQALKVMTWNIQYLAGKRYVFWYDMPESYGPDERPTPEDIAYNLDEVARVIRDEQPDMVLLQELADGAKNADYTDQLALLKARVTDLLPCSAEAFDWKSDFIADRHIVGSVGMKLATLSRYRIDKAERLQLPVTGGNLISRSFAPKPALLVSYLPMRGGGQLVIANTRFVNAHKDRGALKHQVNATAQWLDQWEHNGDPWLMGGDFDLLAQGQYLRLPEAQRGQYSADSELHVIWDNHPMIPSLEDVAGSERRTWLTRFPNDPRISGPDRTQDYLFYSSALRRVDARVRQADTLLISDHLPLIARFLLPGAPDNGSTER